MSRKDEVSVEETISKSFFVIRVFVGEKNVVAKFNFSDGDFFWLG